KYLCILHSVEVDVLNHRDSWHGEISKSQNGKSDACIFHIKNVFCCEEGTENHCTGFPRFVYGERTGPSEMKKDIMEVNIYFFAKNQICFFFTYLLRLLLLLLLFIGQIRFLFWYN